MQQAADILVARALRGGRAEWPVTDDAADFENTVIVRAGYHGVVGLLNAETDAIALWPQKLRSALRSRALAAATWEMRHRSYLLEVTDRLAERHISAVILKGTALAYDLYAEPALRTRSDTDLLVEKSDVDAARRELAALGFAPANSPDNLFGEIHLQESWRRVCPSGTEHHIDLHWQAMNAAALEGVLTFADCLVDPVRLPRLGPAAVAMSHPAMLLHACLHRASHLSAPYLFDGVAYFGGDRLIWLYDVRLLADAMTDAEWQAFLGLVLERGAAEVCLQCLLLAVDRLDAQVPAEIQSLLAALPSAGKADRYLLNMRRLERGIANIKAAKGFKAKFSQVAVRAFPSAQFMRGKYPDSGRTPLLLLYIRRILSGLTGKIWAR